MKKTTKAFCLCGIIFFQDKLFRYYLFARTELTVKRFLPLALLLANTFLPFLVDILSRKPCLFLLFLLDG